MAVDLPVVFNRVDLQQRLSAWPEGDLETSWALCFASAVPAAGEIAAMREAARLCDRVVVVRLVPDKVVPPTYAAVVREAGADLLWCPREVSGRVKVDVQVEGIPPKTSTLLAQALVTVLPGLVVAERGNLALVRALRNFQGGLGELFTLRTV